jgi:hypothetical protein
MMIYAQAPLRAASGFLMASGSVLALLANGNGKGSLQDFQASAQ